ncbi:MAG: DUF72 domain-containing protein [Nitrospirota bacterium]
MPKLFIGCSGFNYPHWKDTFYPHGLPQKRWLEHYRSIFSTVELNVTFYRLPLASSFNRWYHETPADFVFSIKGSRYITHIKRLLDPKEPLELFFERAELLKEKLKVVLWQLPPNFHVDIERLYKFIKLLKSYPVRHTFEFRHESWITDDIVNLCKKNKVSLCMADAPEFVYDLPVTADFVYIRRHGAKGINGDYTKKFLESDAERINEYMRKGKDVFIYFNNDAYGYAPKNARLLMEIMQMEPVT